MAPDKNALMNVSGNAFWGGYSINPPQPTASGSGAPVPGGERGDWFALNSRRFGRL